MKYKEILEKLATCGLNCYKCFANSEGIIRETSIKLRNTLGAFDSYAERFSTFLPLFQNYPSFKDILLYLTRENCNGCRSGSCFYPECGVKNCYKSKGVDFCYQCDEFPCDKSNFDNHLKKRWIEMNKEMKELGVKQYYQKTKDEPRYE